MSHTYERLIQVLTHEHFNWLAPHPPRYVIVIDEQEVKQPPSLTRCSFVPVHTQTKAHRISHSLTLSLTNITFQPTR